MADFDPLENSGFFEQGQSLIPPEKASSGIQYDPLEEADFFAKQAPTVRDVPFTYEGFEEMGATVATGAAATVVAGLAGLGTIINNALGVKYRDPSAVINAIQEAGTYKPRTLEGQKWVELVSWLPEKQGELAKYSGDLVFDLLEDKPIPREWKVQAATTAHAAIEMASIYGVTKAAAAAGKIPQYAPVVKTEAKEKAAEDIVGQSLIVELGKDGESVSRIHDALALRDVVGEDFKPTLADILPERLVAYSQEQLVSGDKVALRTAEQQRKLSLATINNYTNKVLKTDSADIKAIVRESGGNLSKVEKRLAESLEGVRTQQALQLEKLQSAPDHVSGRKLRELAQKEYEYAKSLSNLKFSSLENVDIEARDFLSTLATLDTADFPKDVKRSINGLLEKLPAESGPVGQYGKLEKSPVEVKFYDIWGLNKVLGREIAMLQGGVMTSKDREMARSLAQTKEALNGWLDSRMEAKTKDVVDRYRDANTFFSEAVADRFYSGPVGQSLHKTAQYEFKMLDSQVMDQFGPGKPVENLHKFIEVFGENPEAWAQFRLHVWDDFKQAAVDNKTSTLNPEKAKNWMAKNKYWLDEVPAIRDELSTVGKATEKLALLQKTKEGTLTNMQKSELVMAIKGKNPVEMVESGLKNEKTMLELLKATGKSKEAREGLAKLTGETMLYRNMKRPNEFGEQVLDSHAFLQDMKAHERPIKMAMGKQHYDDLMTAHGAYSLLEHDKLPKGVREEALGLDKIKEFIGSSPTMLVAQWRAVSQGRTGTPQALAQIGASYLTKVTAAQAKAIELKAHLDPEYALTLRMMVLNKAMNPVIENRLRKHIFDLGLTAGIVSLQQEQE